MENENFSEVFFSEITRFLIYFKIFVLIFWIKITQVMNF